MECHFEKGKWGDNDDDDEVKKKNERNKIVLCWCKNDDVEFSSDIYYN